MEDGISNEVGEEGEDNGVSQEKEVNDCSLNDKIGDISKERKESTGWQESEEDNFSEEVGEEEESVTEVERAVENEDKSSSEEGELSDVSDENLPKKGEVQVRISTKVKDVVLPASQFLSKLTTIPKWPFLFPQMKTVMMHRRQQAKQRS